MSALTDNSVLMGQKALTHRKVCVSGAAVLSFVNEQKVRPKGLLLEFPKEAIVAENIQKKSKDAVKSILREQKTKASDAECMNIIGLDVVRVNFFKKNNPLIKKQQSVQFSIRKVEAQFKFPMEEKLKEKILSPLKIKHKSARLQRNRRNSIDEYTKNQQQNCTRFNEKTYDRKIRFDGEHEDKIYELSESLTCFQTKRIPKFREIGKIGSQNSALNSQQTLTSQNDLMKKQKSSLSYSPSKTPPQLEQFQQRNSLSSQMQLFSLPFVPILQSFEGENQNGEQKKTCRLLPSKNYLYKKLEGTEKVVRQQFNLVYQKRIYSYLDFLWKNQISHNVCLNLDLKIDELNKRPAKLKAYVGLGNNGAMIRGLMKRRFWWTLSQERTSDCNFVWTQLKVDSIFDGQKSIGCQKGKYFKKEEEKQKQKQKKKSNEEWSVHNSYNYKVLNDEDVENVREYTDRYQGNKVRSYAFRSEKIGKQLVNGQWTGTIHNHLRNNFYLGNKKALFHSLKEYCGLTNDDPYRYIPLTFHIRKGLKDPEYLRFVEYHRRRARQIKKQDKEQEQEGIIRKRKTKNIWIVKPGENSNQGRGIQVIDEVYELNSIMKQTRDTGTWIVQAYLERPLLYNDRKFDIRHYMLMTCFYGVVRTYWYQEGYIRTSSYPFDLESFEPQIHLTNDAIQKNYPDYHKYEPYNKLSYQQFQRYLDLVQPKKHNFRSQVLPRMKAIGTDAVRSVYTKISPRKQMNNFQIFGLDFMLDWQLRPWLIEVNTNPCLECACPLLDRIIPYMVEQSLKLSLDLQYPPPTHYPNTARHFAPLVALESFKYELIFDSQKEGELLETLYRNRPQDLLQQIGPIEQDQEFREDGREIKLDDYT